MDQSTSTSVRPEKPHDATSAAPSEGKQPQPTPPAKVEQAAQKDEDGDDDDGDDDESDLDDLDDVLDDFSKPANANKQKQPENAPPQPTITTSESEPGNDDDFDEQAFMKQLEQDMANMMSQAQQESGSSDNKEFQDTIEQGADAFAKQLEDSGVPPGDFLKQLLAEVMAEESGDKDKSAGKGAGSSSADTKANKANAQATAATAVTDKTPESFNETIQRTMNRMQESGDKATAAASEDDDIPDEVLLQLLKALESTASGNEDDIQKMFQGFMEKVSSKDILYEPMKELEGKFEPWIAEKKGKGELSDEDVKRYQTQTKIVKDVVAKFEEPGYSDEDPKCREWVWERMQEMQNAGNPPDELIPNPLGDMSGAGGQGAVPPDCVPQ
ncbi:putative peroxisomal membrane protein receptor Pex19 [Aspergillus chevalieri]|uniref:Peroxisome chaperone and import receptor n=1 Tax=Aspergillus chevalieri TaxID=182096 RepID=A0A7R7ZKC5_ASPCH|nr:peroxisome chaperone and import receptor [Aspergillus chevalieri]BCR85610.1 peroxisome chaperone and import receptor [Aspergillus chevalieri]